MGLGTQPQRLHLKTRYKNRMFRNTHHPIIKIVASCLWQGRGTVSVFLPPVIELQSSRNTGFIVWEALSVTPPSCLWTPTPCISANFPSSQTSPGPDSLWVCPLPRSCNGQDALYFSGTSWKWDSKIHSVCISQFFLHRSCRHYEVLKTFHRRLESLLTVPQLTATQPS